MQEFHLSFYSPGLSKANLAEIFEPLILSSEAISLDAQPGRAELDSDPATVALIAAAGTTVAALIQAAAGLYLERKRKRDAGEAVPSVTVKVFGTLGEPCTIELDGSARFNIQSGELPSDPNEIARIRLE